MLSPGLNRSRRIRFAILILLTGVGIAPSALSASKTSNPLPPLKVSDNERFIVTADNKPFFWLGDTAWELFHRLNRDEATVYLENRASLRFNVIQAVVLAELNGLTESNAYGQLPFVKRDPLKPNEAYFEHVDWVV